MLKVTAVAILASCLVFAQDPAQPGNDKVDANVLQLVTPAGKVDVRSQVLNVENQGTSAASTAGAFAAGLVTFGFAGSAKSTINYVLDGAKADTKASEVAGIRLGGLDPRHLAMAFMLVRLEEVKDKDSRHYEVKGSGVKWALKKEFEVFKDLPKPVKGDDGVYAITFPKALDSGHYALIVRAPSESAWDFDVE